MQTLAIPPTRVDFATLRSMELAAESDGEVFWSTTRGRTRWVMPAPGDPAGGVADHADPVADPAADPADAVDPPPPPPPVYVTVHQAQPHMYPVIRQIPTSVEYRAEMLFLQRQNNEMLRWQTEIHLEYARRYDLPHRPPPDLPRYVPQPDPDPSQQAGSSQGRRRRRRRQDYMDESDDEADEEDDDIV